MASEGVSPAHILAEACNSSAYSSYNLTQVGSNAHCCKPEDGGSSESWSVMLGILMGLLGSVMINIGQNLQAMAMQSSPAVKAKPCSSRVWVAGLTIVSVHLASHCFLLPLFVLRRPG